MNEDQPIIKTFDKCPVCGSTERFVGDIAKEQGLENAEMYGINCMPSKIMFGGPVVDQKKMAGALIGATFPFFAAPLDACSNCGCVYTIRQEIHAAKKSITPATPPRGGRGGQMNPGPFLPGPF